MEDNWYGKRHGEEEESSRSSIDTLSWTTTYKWQTAICAHANLRLVGIDKDSGMTQWSTTSITFYNSLVCPSYRLLVNQRDSCLRSWLDWSQKKKCQITRSTPPRREAFDVILRLPEMHIPEIPWSSARTSVPSWPAPSDSDFATKLLFYSALAGL